MGEERERRIRECAFQIWNEEGKPEGKDKDHWERAQAEVEGQASEDKVATPPSGVSFGP